MKAYKCDRCGKLFEHYMDQGTSQFFNITPNPGATWNCLDLCQECNAKLQEWISEGKEGEEEKIEKIPMYPSDSWRCNK